jgi:hypothetical protein
MPLVRGGRPLKRWRYLGGYGPDVCLCLGVVQVGPGVQTFWAVWDRAGRRLTERTVLGRRGVRLGAPGTPVEVASVHGRDVEIDLRVRPDGEPLPVVSPHGRSYIWTRKTPVELTGSILLAGVERSVSCRGLLDDSAGYHARRTEWNWCAGVGSTRHVHRNPARRARTGRGVRRTGAAPRPLVSARHGGRAAGWCQPAIGAWRSVTGASRWS